MECIIEQKWVSFLITHILTMMILRMLLCVLNSLEMQMENFFIIASRENLIWQDNSDLCSYEFGGAKLRLGLNGHSISPKFTDKYNLSQQI